MLCTAHQLNTLSGSTTTTRNIDVENHPTGPEIVLIQTEIFKTKRWFPREFLLHLDSLILIVHNCFKPCFKLFVTLCQLLYGF